MKNSKLTACLLLLAIVVLGSCDKVKEAVKLKKEVQPGAITFTIPPIIVAGQEAALITKEASIDLDQEVKKVDPDYGVENIKSIRIKALKLELLDQFTDANFKALEKISVAIDAEGETEKELASYMNSDFTTDKYTLEVPITGGDIELRDYLNGESFTFMLKGKAHATTNKQVRAKLTVIYDFTLGL